MFDWFELVIVGVQGIRLKLRRLESRSWPTTCGIVQPYKIEKGQGFWAPRTYLSVFAYAFSANESRYTGFFALEAEHEEAARRLQKEVAGTKLTVSYNPRNPDISLLDDVRIFGQRVTQNPHWLP